MALKMVEYKDAKGNSQPAAYVTRGSVYELSGKREKFARLLAQGKECDEAYCEAFEVIPTPDTEQVIGRKAHNMMRETAILLRVADLKKPVLKKLQGKIEYGIQTALQQCQTAWDLAYVQGDAKAMLKASEMLARLSKLLSEEINVTHKHGLLDDTATEVLLEMKREIEVRRERQKKLGTVIEGEIVSVKEGG
jgi:hypothetical protein